MPFFAGLIIGLVIGAVGVFIWAAMDVAVKEVDVERPEHWMRLKAINYPPATY